MVTDYASVNDLSLTAQQWRRFRFYRRCMVIGSMGFILGSSLIVVAINTMNAANMAGTMPLTTTLFFIFAAVFEATSWGLGFYGTIFASTWKCPRCHESYSRTWINNWPWRNHYPHCHLPFGSEL
jgi:hypothetical protein